MVCSILLYPFGNDSERNMPHIDEIFNLRLTCQGLQRNTLDLFIREAFNTTCVWTTYEEFQRLTNIACSQHLARSAPFSKAVKIIRFRPARPIPSEEEVSEMKEKVQDPALDPEKKRGMEKLIRRANEERAGKTFMDNSAAGGIMLATILRFLPKFWQVEIYPFDNTEWPLRQSLRLPAYELRTNRMFSMALSSLAFAGTRLQSLRVSDRVPDMSKRVSRSNLLCFLNPSLRVCGSYMICSFA